MGKHGEYRWSKKLYYLQWTRITFRGLQDLRVFRTRIKKILPKTRFTGTVFWSKSGTLTRCGKWQTCEFTERRNNGMVQINSQCKQKRACNNSVKHNKYECKQLGKRDRKLIKCDLQNYIFWGNGVLVSSTCRQCFPNAMLFSQVLDLLDSKIYPHTMFSNDQFYF